MLRAFLLAGLLVPGTIAAQTPLRIVAPAAPGGGWDQLARTMQRVLEREGIASRVQVDNAPGAAGTVGLARFISTDRGDGTALLVTGLVMVGGIIQNGSPVSLSGTTPIARLVGEYEVLAVPAGSPFASLGDLLTVLRADPGSVSWGGGSAGGTDQILVDLIARAAGLDPRRTNYVAFSGGGETRTALLGAQVSVAVSGLGEFADLIRSGQVRALAISAPQRVPGLEVPTLIEGGLDIELANWRGVVAPPGLLPAERLDLETRIERMAASAAWQEELGRRGWEPLWLAGDAFGRFVAAETERVERLDRLKRGERESGGGATWLPLVALAGLIAGAAGMAWEHRRRNGGRHGRSLVAGQGGSTGTRTGRRRVALILTGIIANILLAEVVGFVGASTVMFAAAAAAFGARPVRAVLTGVVYSAAVYAAFALLLDVRLPSGALFR